VRLSELEERFPEPSIYRGLIKSRNEFDGGARTLDRLSPYSHHDQLYLALHRRASVLRRNSGRPRSLVRETETGFGRGWETAAKYLTQLRPQLEWISVVLSDGRRYLFGDNLSLADFIVYHALWIMDQLAYERVALIPAGIRQWMDRIAASGMVLLTDVALEALEIEPPRTRSPLQASR